MYSLFCLSRSSHRVMRFTGDKQTHTRLYDSLSLCQNIIPCSQYRIFMELTPNVCLMKCWWLLCFLLKRLKVNITRVVLMFLPCPLLSSKPIRTFRFICSTNIFQDTRMYRAPFIGIKYLHRWPVLRTMVPSLAVCHTERNELWCLWSLY